jgi:hypothetical protein
MVGHTLEEVVVGLEILRWCATDPFEFHLLELAAALGEGVDDADDVARDLVLNGEKVLGRAIVALGPSRRSIDAYVVPILVGFADRSY